MHEHEAHHVNCVGKSKLKTHLHEHSWGGSVLPMDHTAMPSKSGSKGVARTTAEQLYFQLKEFEEFRHPSFNVLYVQTPKPALAKAPLLDALSGLVAETVEMVAPLLRLGIPENSIKDKLPHFRDDYSPLPNNVRPRVQKVLRSNIQFAEQQAAVSRQLADEWDKIKRESRKSNKQSQQHLPQLNAVHQQLIGGSDHGHHKHIPHPNFYTHEMPTWVVPVLNLAAYWYLCGLGGLDLWMKDKQ